MSFDEELLERIKNKEVFVIVCEPLADYHHNLRFCPNREECEWLHEEIENDPSVAEELVEWMNCGFCKSEDWLLVLASDRLLMTSTCSPEFGKKVKEILHPTKSVVEK